MVKKRTEDAFYRIYINMDFFDSAEAAEMAEAYRQQINSSIMKVEELLKEADATERRIEATHKVLMRRRRVRLELRLQRILLDILTTLTPESQELGCQVYERLICCVDRLEKLC